MVDIVHEYCATEEAARGNTTRAVNCIEDKLPVHFTQMTGCRRDGPLMSRIPLHLSNRGSGCLLSQHRMLGLAENAACLCCRLPSGVCHAELLRILVTRSNDWQALQPSDV
jgi:hypothetical protein